VRVLAIDLGTAAIRAGLFEEGGVVLGIEHHPLADPDGAGVGSAEQDPLAWWTAIVDMCRTLAIDHGSRVDAICAVGHGPTCVAVDGSGAATRPAITWRDLRTAPLAEELTAATGLDGWALGLLPAALFVERSDAEAAAATRWYLGTWEWLGLRLGGRAVTTARPEDPVLEAAATLGFDIGRIPPEAEQGTAIGTLGDDVATELGLAAGPPVVIGTFDAAASVLGAGLVARGQSIDVGGAAGGFALMTDRPVQVGPYVPFPALVPDRWLLGGAMAATGSSLDWLVWNVLGGVIERDRLVGEAAEIEPGADGLLFLPYLAGERDPIHDPHATGAFVGLTLAHRRAHLARAVLEAAAFAVRHVAAPLIEAGLHVTEMRVAGGPARSEAWNRIKADATGFPVAVPAIPETALLGAAILGRAAVNGSSDLAALAASDVRIDHVIEPDPDRRDLYDEAFRRYVALYPAIAGVMDQRS
jgi:xylulokinase